MTSARVIQIARAVRRCLLEEVTQRQNNALPLLQIGGDEELRAFLTRYPELSDLQASRIEIRLALQYLHRIHFLRTRPIGTGEVHGDRIFNVGLIEVNPQWEEDRQKKTPTTNKPTRTGPILKLPTSRPTTPEGPPEQPKPTAPPVQSLPPSYTTVDGSNVREVLGQCLRALREVTAGEREWLRPVELDCVVVVQLRLQVSPAQARKLVDLLVDAGLLIICTNHLFGVHVRAEGDHIPMALLRRAGYEVGETEDDLRRIIESLRAKLRGAEKPNEELAQEVKDLRAKLALKNDEVNQLRQRLLTQASQQKTQTQEVEDLTEVLGRRNEQIAELQQQIAELEARVHDIGQRAATLQAQKAMLERRLARGSAQTPMQASASIDPAVIARAKAALARAGVHL